RVRSRSCCNTRLTTSTACSPWTGCWIAILYVPGRSGSAGIVQPRRLPPHPLNRIPMQRRTVIGSVSLGSVAGLGAWAYRTSPAFWERFAADLKRDVLAAPEKPDPKSWSDRGIYAAWLGHTSVLLKVDGTTILTDPVFSNRIGLNFGPMTLGLKR